ncbi:hypothetical protein Anapl_07955 [Anas platyrhynchos]|uniref:Uncharacterized protein n=1 Tax=Anas platyrhynchos TaxID=8839 RepID=R0LGR8_ANAPL|nr:hypothetical protein Anapl_07955 [Anas platyrhynchos]
MCWPAFQNSLAWSQLLALAIRSVEERDGKGLVVDCCADLPFPPGVTGSTSTSYPQEFQDKELEDEEESEGSFSSPPDSVSIASDRYDKDDEGHSDGM